MHCYLRLPLRPGRRRMIFYPPLAIDVSELPSIPCKISLYHLNKVPRVCMVLQLSLLRHQPCNLSPSPPPLPHQMSFPSKRTGSLILSLKLYLDPSDWRVRLWVCLMFFAHEGKLLWPYCTKSPISQHVFGLHGYKYFFSKTQDIIVKIHWYLSTIDTLLPFSWFLRKSTPHAFTPTVP